MKEIIDSKLRQADDQDSSFAGDAGKAALMLAALYGVLKSPLFSRDGSFDGAAPPGTGGSNGQAGWPEGYPVTNGGGSGSPGGNGSTPIVPMPLILRRSVNQAHGRAWLYVASSSFANDFNKVRYFPEYHAGSASVIELDLELLDAHYTMSRSHAFVTERVFYNAERQLTPNGDPQTPFTSDSPLLYPDVVVEDQETYQLQLTSDSRSGWNHAQGAVITLGALATEERTFAALCFAKPPFKLTAVKETDEYFSVARETPEGFELTDEFNLSEPTLSTLTQNELRALADSFNQFLSTAAAWLDYPNRADLLNDDFISPLPRSFPRVSVNDGSGKLIVSQVDEVAFARSCAINGSGLHCLYPSDFLALLDEPIVLPYIHGDATPEHDFTFLYGQVTAVHLIKRSVAFDAGLSSEPIIVDETSPFEGLFRASRADNDAFFGLPTAYGSFDWRPIRCFELDPRIYKYADLGRPETLTADEEIRINAVFAGSGWPKRDSFVARDVVKRTAEASPVAVMLATRHFTSSGKHSLTPPGLWYGTREVKSRGTPITIEQDDLKVGYTTLIVTPRGIPDLMRYWYAKNDLETTGGSVMLGDILGLRNTAMAPVYVETGTNHPVPMHAARDVVLGLPLQCSKLAVLSEGRIVDRRICPDDERDLDIRRSYLVTSPTQCRFTLK